ncbi:MAG: hypothetical protein IKC81_07695 [Paludibacteraceae bacterium]|nr:hypothetical protein [Paludibacteraceae bacterium]
MTTQSDTSCLEYDDDAAIAFIMKRLPDNLKSVIDEDDVQYLLDVMYEYYETNNFLDEETDETVEIAEEDLLQYILVTAKKDGMDVAKFTAENIQVLLDIEYEYSKSLGVY